MKNIILDTKQLNFIKESIDNNDKLNKISQTIVNDVDNGETPLSCLVNSNKYIKKMLLCSYNDAIKSFNDDITQYDYKTILNKQQKLIAICQKKEGKIKEQLEKLICDITSLIFKSDTTIKLDCKLINSVSSTKDFHVKSNLGDDDIVYDDSDEIDTLESDKKRRKFINAITFGASLNLCDKILKDFLNDIFELDNELPALYNKIIKINDYLLFINNDKVTDKNNMQGAYETVTYSKENNDATIESNGIIFPFLLTETIRAFIELKSINTISDNDKHTEIIIDSCDVLEDEKWYMIFGRYIWKNIIGDNDIDVVNYESILDTIFDMDKNDIDIYSKELLLNTNKGKEISDEIIKTAKYNSDYSNFLKTLTDKREENNLVTDEYFSEDELIDENDIYNNKL